MEFWKRNGPNGAIWQVWLKVPEGHPTYPAGAKRFSTGIRAVGKSKSAPKEAVEWAQRKQRELDDPSVQAAAEATVISACEAFLKARKLAEKSEATLTYYTYKLSHVARLIEEGRFPRLLKNVNLDALERYASIRKGEPGVSGQTVHKEIGTLMSVLKYARKRGLWSGDLDNVRPEIGGPSYVPRRRYLTAEELWGLVLYFMNERRYLAGNGATKTAGPYPGRAAILLFMVGTGARWSEALKARWDDVHKHKPDEHGVWGHVHLHGTKTEKSDRDVPLVPQFADLLKWSLAHARKKSDENEEGFLFAPWANVIRDLREACTALGIPPVSPNDLRRTCGTWLRVSGASLEDIADFMGHTTTKLTFGTYTQKSVLDLGGTLARPAWNVCIVQGA